LLFRFFFFFFFFFRVNRIKFVARRPGRKIMDRRSRGSRTATRTFKPRKLSASLQVGQLPQPQVHMRGLELKASHPTLSKHRNPCIPFRGILPSPKRGIIVVHHPTCVTKSPSSMYVQRMLRFATKYVKTQSIISREQPPAVRRRGSPRSDPESPRCSLQQRT